MKWEYKAEKIIAANLENRLNSLGDDGWELVDFFPEGDHNYRVVLKRLKEAPIREEYINGIKLT